MTRTRATVAILSTMLACLIGFLQFQSILIILGPPGIHLDAADVTASWGPRQLAEVVFINPQRAGYLDPPQLNKFLDTGYLTVPWWLIAGGWGIVALGIWWWRPRRRRRGFQVETK